MPKLTKDSTLHYGWLGHDRTITAPAGTPVYEAVNLPPAADGMPRYWVEIIDHEWADESERWPHDAVAWARAYGFLVSPEDYAIA